MYILLFCKQSVFIYIISFNPFNDPILKKKKKGSSEIWEPVSGHTSEIGGAESQNRDPQTKPVLSLLLSQSLSNWLPGTSNTLDQSLKEASPQSPSTFSVFLGR